MGGTDTMVVDGNDSHNGTHLRTGGEENDHLALEVRLDEAKQDV